MATANYPPGGIYFSVVIDGEETAFEQISGLPTSFAVEVIDDGQGYHEYQSPEATQPSNLILIRGITSSQSKFTKWCAATLNSSITSPINTKDIKVSLSPKLGIDMTRVFYKAYPIKWSTSLLQQDDMLAIDEVEFAYNYFHNISAIK